MKRVIFSMLLITIFVPALVFTQEVQPVPRAAAPQPAPAQQARAARAREIDMRARELEEQARNLEMREREIDERAGNLEMRENELREHAENIKMREREMESAKKEKDLQPLFLLILVVNILCAVWVYQDIQKRSRESGLWIVIALITGLLGTLVYAIVRLVDNTKNKT